MSIPPSGNIKVTPLPNILEQLQKSNATGTLIVRNRGIEKAIHLKGGKIIFAASTDDKDRLGEILVSCCKLSRESLEQALQLSKQSAGLKKLGVVLVEKGLVTPKDLFTGLKTQVKDIIYSLFLWNEGEYHFKEQLPPDVIQLQIDIQELVTEIIRRIQKET